MSFSIHDELFVESELAKLDLSSRYYKSVTERAPDHIVMDLWPEGREQPNSTISFKILLESDEDEDDLGAAAKRIAASCFAHIPWKVCHARYFHYDIGHRVVKHVDGNDKQMAAILYLSQDWEPVCAGELEIEFEGQMLEVSPVRGRVVVVGPDVPHGTKKVEKGARVCIVFFYSNA